MSLFQLMLLTSPIVFGFGLVIIKLLADYALERDGEYKE